MHPSLPIYSGGLGVLAGDIVKAAVRPRPADGGRRPALPQRLLPPAARPLRHAARVLGGRRPRAARRASGSPTTHGQPLTVTVPVGDEDVTVHVWRVDVGRVPLYLLDTDRRRRTRRWAAGSTARLYDGNRRDPPGPVRGAGRRRGAGAATRWASSRPCCHLNEGHPALAALRARWPRRASGGVVRTTPGEQVRAAGIVFTTHTPGARRQRDLRPRRDRSSVLGRLARPDAATASGSSRWAGSTRTTRRSPRHDRAGAAGVAGRPTAVSRRHGEVARDMWQPLFGGASARTCRSPTSPTACTCPPGCARRCATCSTATSATAGSDRADEPEHLGAGRRHPRRRAVGGAQRGPAPRWSSWLAARRPPRTACGAARTSTTPRRPHDGFDPDAPHARLRPAARHLQAPVPAGPATPTGPCGCSAATRPVQFVFAGKAHPADDGAKAILRDAVPAQGQRRASAHGSPSSRTTTCRSAAELVAGCDVWVNLPRPPQEASGTSGMKAALNGGLNLSVLDGWWAEAYDGTNGWAIDGDVDRRPRGPGPPRTPTPSSTCSSSRSSRCSTTATTTASPPAGWRWCEASLRTNGPRFSAARMVSGVRRPHLSGSVRRRGASLGSRAVDAKTFLGLAVDPQPQPLVPPGDPGRVDHGQLPLGRVRPGCRHRGHGAHHRSPGDLGHRPVPVVRPDRLDHGHRRGHRPPQGKSITQARAIGHVGDREILTVNAALGHRDPPATGMWATMPDVPPPDECRAALRRGSSRTTSMHDARLDFRLADARSWDEIDGDPGAGRAAARCGPACPRCSRCRGAALAILGDYVPVRPRTGARSPRRRQQPRQHLAHGRDRRRPTGSCSTSGSTPSPTASGTASCTCGPRTAPCWPPPASRPSCAIHEESEAGPRHRRRGEPRRLDR